jgi:hypothetical protein
VTAALKGIFSRLAAFGGGDVEVWEGGALRAGFGQGCVMQVAMQGNECSIGEDSLCNSVLLVMKESLDLFSEV